MNKNSNIVRQTFANSRDFHARHRRPISQETTLESLTDAGRVTEEDVKHYIESTRIIVHPKVLKIANDFLTFKKIHGTTKEKHVYSTQIDWNAERLMIRLIKQRPLVFYMPSDKTLLRTHRDIASAVSEWDRVGTDNESSAIKMEDYMTYEEMMISSLIGVSGYTPFINDGNRYNRGKFEDPQSTQPEGVQVGLVGARFERYGRMDSVYASESRPGPKTFPFASYFPGDNFEQRYKSRIAMTIDTLLLEADSRGLEAQKKAYVHVVGLGLGVWAIHEDQPRWYIEVFTERLAKLKLASIHTLEFAWIDVDPSTRDAVVSAANKAGITSIFNRRAPSARLPDPSLLLVASYAWDSNAYPGNEYYLGALASSGDPAAACSTAISETHNPEVNTWMLENIHLFDA
ncbi:Hypothetical protein D9617_43g040220 [Elsinoe fawcettii]|nr:Hypothetical protein D9617_43g040220 [Elsinoe fawcettii]